MLILLPRVYYKLHMLIHSFFVNPLVELDSLCIEERNHSLQMAIQRVCYNIDFKEADREEPFLGIFESRFTSQIILKSIIY